jgi:2-dehydro-3-deoxygluconokinase
MITSSAVESQSRNLATPRQTVLTFGELLLRLDASGHERFVQAAHYRASFTGGEANVAVALAGWGLDTRLVSRVPGHAIGDACLNHFRRYGVDTSHVLRGGERLGILFVETGASQRPPQVIYDRLHSAFRELRAVDLDWDRVYANAAWLHVTGTAPAVGDPVRQTLYEALRQAKARGLRVSFDCSYRSALWSVTEAAVVLQSLLEFVDVFIGSESDARQFFDIHSTGEACLKEFRERFGLTCVAFTDRIIRPDGTHVYSATTVDATRVCASRVYDIHVVDRIGAGDAFAAGLIYGLLSKQPLPEATEFAVAAGVLAHTIPGDFALVTVQEVEHLATGGATIHGWR